MKTVIVLFVILFLFSCKPYNEKIYLNEVFAYSVIPMPEEYRKLTGCDSIQIFAREDSSMEANFCSPNKWESEKYKNGFGKLNHITITNFGTSDTLQFFNNSGTQNNNMGTGIQTINNQ